MACGCASVGTYPQKLQKKIRATQTDQSHTHCLNLSLCHWSDIAQIIKGKLGLLSKANLFMLIVFMPNLSITLINTVCLIGK